MEKVRLIKDGNPVNVITAVDCVFDMGLPIIKPEDFSGSSIAEKVIAANNFILESNGGYELRFEETSEYLITQAIVLPSNTIVRIVGCTIRMADNTVDNMFRTANITPDPEHPVGHATNKSDMPTCKNIKIIGESATLIMENNASQSSELVVGWRGNVICFAGVDGFEVAGLSIEKNLCWTINIARCRNGKVHDIVFNTTRENGDGIDVMGDNIDVYNISGSTQDDTTVVYNVNTARYTARPAEVDVPIVPFDYAYDFGYGHDSHDIHFHNVHATGTNHILILITGTYEIYNVTASNISDKDSTSQKNAIVKIYGGQYNGNYNYNLIHNCCFNDIYGHHCSKGTIWFSQGVIKDGRFNLVKTPSGKTSVSNESGATLVDYDCVITNQVTV